MGSTQHSTQRDFYFIFIFWFHVPFSIFDFRYYPLCIRGFHYLVAARKEKKNILHVLRCTYIDAEVSHHSANAVKQTNEY